MSDKKIPFFKKLLFSGLAFLLTTIVLFAIGELAMRLFGNPLSPPYDNKQKDEVSGWKSKAGYSYQTDAFPDNKGGNYPVKINFSRHGFRKWDTTQDTGKKPAILFIGDSFVESLQCSDDETFYSIFADSLPCRVFAYGSSGYGTTQELLVLQQYLDSINPKFVVLEMCANDFSDNYWELEKETGYKVGLKRPYLTLNNNIEYHHPHYWLEDIKQYSHLLYFLVTKGRNALIKLKLISSDCNGDRMINEQGLNYPKYNTAYKLTGNCLKNMKQKLDARGIKLIAFIAGNFEPAKTDLTRLCADNGIAIIPNVASEVEKHENAGEVVKAYDGFHWSPNGQRIVAVEIIKYFKEQQLLQ